MQKLVYLGKCKICWLKKEEEKDENFLKKNIATLLISKHM
jgi:hypothetical protein